MALENVLAQPAPLRWLIGRVAGITGNTFTMTYRGGDVPGVGHLDSYTPVVGDVVHVLSWPDNGMIAIGSQNATEVPRWPTEVSVGNPLIVMPTQVATYTPSTGAWTPNVITQGPDSVGCWFYNPSDFTAFNLALLGEVAIEINPTDGGPPEFCEVTNTLPAGSLTLVEGSGSRYGRAQPTLGAAIWLTLPLDWGLDLAAGTANAVGIGGGLYDGTYSGTGRVRLTPR